jgi:hypothetical protein
MGANSPQPGAYTVQGSKYGRREKDIEKKRKIAHGNQVHAHENQGPGCFAMV